MSVIKDHVVKCDEGFYDMQRYPERIEHGGTAVVTKETFRQMKGSDPSVRLLRIEPPKEILQAIVENARKEKAARGQVVIRDATPEEEEVEAALKQVADPSPTDEPRSWEPVGWYKAQLNKDGGMDD